MNSLLYDYISTLPVTELSQTLIEISRAAGGEWQVWEQLSINEVPLRRAVMTKLQKGQEYQFRLIAVNKAGKSEPSHPSRPKVAKETDRK